MNKNYLIAFGIFLTVGIALFALLTFFVAPRVDYAASPTGTNLDSETLRVAKGLYCPVCPGVPLDVCDTQACQQWRGVIKQKLSEGQNASQIEAYFVEQYGERVLGAPRAQGLNLLVYALPAFVVSAGAAMLYLFVKRRTAQSPIGQAQVGQAQVGQAQVGQAQGIAPTNEFRARIERELQENE